MFVNKPNYSIQAFREAVSSRGFQSANRYTVTIQRKHGGISGIDNNLMSMYPESVVLPEQQITTFPDLGFTTPRNIPSSSEQGSILMTFMTMKDWKERTYFENWMNCVAYGKDEGNLLGINKNFVLPYNRAADSAMTITFYDENITDKVTKKYRFYEVYPQTIAPTSFDSGASGYNSFTVILNVRSRNFNYN